VASLPVLAQQSLVNLYHAATSVGLSKGCHNVHNFSTSADGGLAYWPGMQNAALPIGYAFQALPYWLLSLAAAASFCLPNNVHRWLPTLQVLVFTGHL
jgi:hypothetical protein